MSNIIQFKKKKPNDIKPYIDWDKGWKFTEDDKEFLLNFYKEYLEFIQEDCGGDGAEEAQKIIDSIEKNGVLANKYEIQCDAENYALGFGSDIYEKYSDSPNILKFIENSIVDIQW